jgi:HKD family nuclease
MSNDLTFFTNEENATLLDRFITVLNHAKYFDVLVGYFRTSGFFRLYESFEGIEKVRILVGLNVDRKTFEIFEASKQGQFDFESNDRTKKAYSTAIQTELEKSEDKYDIEIGIRKFIEFLQSGKIEIKAYPNEHIHAKVYISRFSEEHIDYGRVITGSSNFS